MNNIQEGDMVSILDEPGVVKVLRLLDGSTALIQDESGFEHKISLSKLVRRAKKEEYHVNAAMIEEKKDSKVTPPELEYDEVWEVDLHLEELPGFPVGKGDHEKLMFQIKYFKKCIDAALLHRIQKVIFIHGVGKGTLKAELIRTLRDYELAEYYEAPFKKYGYGAMVVEL